MGKITKINIDNVDYQIEDERLDEVAEVVSAALNDVKEDPTELSDSDLYDIFYIVPPKETADYYLYTEDFEDYDPDEYASENGYSDFAEMAQDFVNAAPNSGAQRFYDSGQTIDYDGQTLSLWVMEAGEGGEFSETGYFGVLKPGVTRESLEEEAMVNDTSNRYEPFVATATDDGSVYNETGNGRYCLVCVVDK